METLGKRIAALRKEKNMTQEELGQKFDISAQAVSKWENDQTCPDITALPKLGQVLGVSVDELLSGKQDSAPVKLVPEAQRKDPSDMMLRMVVDSSDGDRVRINLPLPLVQVGLEMGMDVSQVSGNQAMKSVDLGKVMELVNSGVVGDLMEVESSDGDIVRIFVE